MCIIIIAILKMVLKVASYYMTQDLYNYVQAQRK